ncbi:MAG: acyl-CoA reductase [Verrucomicrobiota bacterium]
MTNLPHYFLADLPQEASLTPRVVIEACQTLKRNRARYLADRSTGSIVRLLSEVAGNWRDEAYPFRRLALEHGPAHTGFSRAILQAGLDAYFAQLTAENLEALLVQELGHADRLDAPTSAPTEPRGARIALASGPELLAHIAAGNLPNPTVTSIVLGLLLRSAQFVKCARGASFIPRLFAHSLYEADSRLGACLEIAEWPGGEESLEFPLFAESQCVTATGNDKTLAAIRRRVPHNVRFVGYGHRVSFGFVTHEAFQGFRTRKIVAHAADDIVAWDQLGCLSPHAFYVQDDGRGTAQQFAEMLVAELERREQSHPRGTLSTEAAAAIATRRAFYEIRSARASHTRQWCSPGSTAWTVIYEEDPLFQPSCLNRFVYVKAATDLEAVLRGADRVLGQVSTVGLAAAEHEARDLVMQLARWGVTRVCSIGQMQHPPLTWRHDGRPSLGDLVTWTDWEQ